MFRITVRLKDEVDGVLLEEALNKVLYRFPTYKTRLKKGYSWHYLEENTERAVVFKGLGPMLCPIDTAETNGYLFRVVYEGKTVYFEVFHGLCDGVGATIFV
ncbi:MAG: alcohol acetyltransferase, partial [Clostridia bacterium]|nr:alcohol acetyltransferase [Clostridia bacterium]